MTEPDWRARGPLWCASQHPFTSRGGADLYARWMNEATAYNRPIVGLRCRWCDGWHVAVASNNKQFKQTRKARRKWRAQQVIAGSTRT